MYVIRVCVLCQVHTDLLHVHFSVCLTINHTSTIVFLFYLEGTYYYYYYYYHSYTRRMKTIKRQCRKKVRIHDPVANFVYGQ